MTDRRELIQLVRQFADRAFQWLLEAPEHARGLMLLLEPELAEGLDFSRMEQEPPIFLDDNLRERVADRFLRVPCREPVAPACDEVLVWVLFEHQSTPSAEMAASLLQRMSGAWNRQREGWESSKTPAGERWLLPIIPVVFYTGKDKWEMEISLASQMRLPRLAEPYVPRWRVLTFDLQATPGTKLAACDHPFAALLRAWQAESGPVEEFEAAVLGALQEAERLRETDVVAFEKAVIFLYLLVHRGLPSEEGRALTMKMNDFAGRRPAAEEREMAETLWDVAVNEGRAEAKQDDVLTLMAEKFGPVPEQIAARVRALTDLEKLGVLLRRVLHADTMEAMGL